MSENKQTHWMIRGRRAGRLSGLAASINGGGAVSRRRFVRERAIEKKIDRERQREIYWFSRNLKRRACLNKKTIEKKEQFFFTFPPVFSHLPEIYNFLAFTHMPGKKPPVYSGHSYFIPGIRI